VDVVRAGSCNLSAGSKLLQDSHIEGLANTLAGIALTSLDFSNNRLSAVGARHAAALLDSHPDITSLDLRGNHIGDEGARNLAESLKGNSTLTSLDLRRNGITDEGALHLAGLLQENTTLTSLDLRHNRDIRGRGVMCVEKALRHSGGTPDINVLDCGDVHSRQRLADAIETNRNKVMVLTLHCSQVEAGGLNVAFTNLAGTEVATLRAMLGDTVSSLTAQVAKELSFPARCLRMVLPNGTLLEEPTHALTLREVIAK